MSELSEKKRVLATVGVSRGGAAALTFLDSCRGDRVLYGNHCIVYRNSVAMDSTRKNDNGEHACYCANR
jgi:hypothetical protein